MVEQWFPGWWLLLTRLKNDGVSNSWDHNIPNWMEKNIMFQTADFFLAKIMIDCDKTSFDLLEV